MDKQKSFLSSERQLTDESLVAERDNTNRSLHKSVINTENQIDKTFSENRNKAGQVVEAVRFRADIKNDNRQTPESQEVEDEKQVGKERVARERERSDNAVELARSEVDAALEIEREIRSALANRLLDQERKLTDKSLSFERTQTDSEVLRSSGLLSSEKSEHSKTKVSLTTRNEILAIVSHDLRNPIGAASSCAAMLLEDSAFSNIDPEVRYLIEFIKRNVDVSLRMIADLLDMESGALGKLQLKIEKHSIGQIIRQSVDVFAHAASAKKIVLRVIPPVGPDHVNCDYDRVLQVLSNLISNAIKFTPEAGTATVNASVSDLEIRVSVSDTGPGIPKDKLEKIFGRLEQLGARDGRGLGLGLYISKMLVDAHGGRIWAESKVNEGSTLWFTLPASSAQSAPSLH